MLTSSLLHLIPIKNQSARVPVGEPAILNTAGFNWTNIWLVSVDSTRQSTSPAITVDGSGNIYMVWNDDSVEYDGETYPDIVYRMWNATSGEWGGQVNSTDLISTISTSYAYYPDIAVDWMGNIHVVWQDQSSIMGAGSNYDIFYRYWNASMKVWSGHTGIYDLLTPPTHTSPCINPAIAVDAKGNVHVVWADQNNLYGDGPNWDIFYKCWNITTGVWEQIEVVSNESIGGNSYTPRIAVDVNLNVHVVWYDNTNYSGAQTDYDIFYKLWNATIGGWSATEVVSWESVLVATKPDIAVDDRGNVFVTWYDNTAYPGAGSADDVIFKYRNTTTKIWSGYTNTVDVLSNFSGSSYSRYPRIGVDPLGNIFVTWQQYGSYFGDYHDDIAIRIWNASLRAWQSTQFISSADPRYSYAPDIAVDGTGAAHVIWDDYISSYNYKVYYRKTITTAPPRTTLKPIYPNPSSNLEIDLQWRVIIATNRYYIYRNTSYISSLSGLTPIVMVSGTSYTDIVTQNNTYYYVVVSGNNLGNSSISNCENVTVYSIMQFRRITITNNSDFPTYASSGNGSSANPWIIENYNIDGAERPCISISDTTDHFVLQNSFVYGGSSGIILKNVVNGQLFNNTAYTNNNAFLLNGSVNNLLLNNTARFNNIGFYLTSSDGNDLINNKAYNNSGFGTYSGLGFLLEFSDQNWLDGNHAFNNSGISGLSCSGDGFVLWDSNLNNLTNNFAYHNYHYNTTYSTVYGGIGFLGRTGSANNNFIGNIAFGNRGLTAYHSMGFFFMSGGGGNLFEQNLVYDHVGAAIYFRNSANNNQFINNTIHHNQYGVETIGTGYPIIKYNKIFENYYGTYLWGGNSVVHKNNVWNNTYGIYFVAAGGDTATNNTIYNNTYDGIRMSNSNAIKLYNNTIYDNQNGINLANAPSCILIDNKVYNNTNYGVTLYDNYTKLVQNTVFGNDIGIYLGSASANSIYSNITLNEIRNNREGIHLRRCYENQLNNNLIYENTEYGIYIENSWNSRIIDNDIVNNSEGIHLWGTYNISIQLNNISNNNQMGIYLEETRNSKVEYNDIFNNTQNGIYVENCNESLITWNMIFDNGEIFSKIGGINNTIEKNFCFPGTILDPITPNPSIDGWITLHWDAVPWATYYLVYRKFNEPFTKVYDFVVNEPVKNVTTNSALDNEIPIKGMFYYVVIAGNETGWSIWSNDEWVNVTGYPVPESSTLDSLIKPDYNGQIELSWSMAINATIYYVFRDTSKITDVSGLTPIVVTSQLSFIDSIFTNGTYFYVIVAGNPDYNSTISNCENVTVILYPSPNIPNLYAITPQIDYDGSIKLDWTDCINTNYYYIYRDTSNIIDISSLTPIGIVIQSNYTETISFNGTIFYVIVASNPSLNGTFSNCRNVTVILYPTILTPILNPMPTQNYDGLVTISWVPTANTVNYYVYRDSSIITNVNNLIPIAKVTAPQVTFINVIVGNGTYFYAIVAGNPSHNSSVSNSRGVTIILYPPPLVPNLYAINGSVNGRVFLNWSITQNAIYYYIYRDTSAILDITGRSPIAVTTQLFYVDTLSQNGTFFYVIMAGNPGHNSSISNYQSVNVIVYNTPEEPGNFPWYIIIIIVAAVAALTTLFVVRSRRKPKAKFVPQLKTTKILIGEVRRQLKDESSLEGKIKVLQDNAVPLEIIPELYDEVLLKFFKQDFTSVPIDLLEFLQKIDLPVEDKLEIIMEFKNLSDSRKAEFLEELKES